MLFDSTLKNALGPEGFSNTGISFKTFNAVSINGTSYCNDSLKNKITFINFWYEHCQPCIVEFEALNRLYDQYKNNPKFRFLSFTFETNENAVRVVNKYRLNYPIVCLDRNTIYHLNFYLGFPNSFITDEKGEINFVKCGNSIEKQKSNAEINVFQKRIGTLLDRK